MRKQLLILACVEIEFIIEYQQLTFSWSDPLSCKNSHSKSRRKTEWAKTKLTTSPREIPKWVKAEASFKQRWWVSPQLYSRDPYTTEVLSLQTLAARSRKVMGDKGTKFAGQRERPSIDSHEPGSLSCEKLQNLRQWQWDKKTRCGDLKSLRERTQNMVTSF